MPCTPLQPSPPHPQSFLLCPDEEWFRLLHVEVEAQAAGAVGQLQGMQAAAAQVGVRWS